MNDLMTPMSNFQDGYICREQKKRTRLYIDNEFLVNGYGGLLERKALVYMCLTKYAHAETQTCFPSYDTIRRETGIKNRNTIARAISILEYLRLIAVKYAHNGRSNKYYLLHHLQWLPLTSITIDTARRVSKMGRKEYQKRLLGGINRDTRSHRSNLTKEVPVDNEKGFQKMKDLMQERNWHKGEDK